MAKLAARLSGVVTGLLHTKLQIPGILAGILTQIALYSINIRIIGAANVPLLGEDTVTALRVGEAELPAQCVFLLRSAFPPADLLPDLALEDGYITVDRRMRTNLPGVFAAGDCTGLPLQLAKAVGEGLVAGQSAAEYVDQHADSESENH